MSKDFSDPEEMFSKMEKQITQSKVTNQNICPCNKPELNSYQGPLHVSGSKSKVYR